MVVEPEYRLSFPPCLAWREIPLLARVGELLLPILLFQRGFNLKGGSTKCIGFSPASSSFSGSGRDPSLEYTLSLISASSKILLPQTTQAALDAVSAEAFPCV